MNPASPYAIAKLASYHITKIYRESYNIFAVNGILFNHESERRGINFVTAKIVLGALSIKYGLKQKLELGNLDAARDWGFAGDYVKAMWLMLQQKKPIDLVIATGQTKTVRDVCKYVFKKVGLKNYKKYVVTKKKFLRPNELYYLNGDAKLAKKTIGWKPTVTFENLLDDMINKLETRMFKKN
jgi:GDPmannose 4,6-dehydratase